MQYKGDVYRPPSEAHSLITQVAIGCPHNKCTFCHMYTDKRFHVRKREEILTDLDKYRDTHGPYVQCVLLADGNTLVVKTELLLELLHCVKRNFPYAKRITSYGTAKDVLRKSEEELVAPRKARPAMICLDVESGDGEVLVHIQKGGTAEEIIVTGQRLERCGIQTSVTLISGLGGSAGTETHAMKLTEFINAVNPECTSTLTLHLSPGSSIAGEIQRSETELLKPDQIMDETELFLTRIDSPGTVFRTNHASNYLALADIFNQDPPCLLREVRKVREYSRYYMESQCRGS